MRGAGHPEKQIIIQVLLRQGGGTMKVIAFLADFAVVERISDHLQLTFVADKSPPPRIADQELSVAAETGGGCFS